MDDPIHAYLRAIRDGTEIVGKWVRLLYERIDRGIRDGTYRYDAGKADRAVRFLERFMRHNKGPLAPGPLTLSLWERALIAAIFGVLGEDGRRAFREIFLVVGRKCGKTLLCGGIILYEAYCDGEFGSEIYCVGPKMDQADLCYAAFEFAMEHEPALSRRTRKRKTDHLVPATNTTIRKIAFNEKKADGYSPSLTVADEIASWPAARGLRMYEVLVSGAGARTEPLTLAISSGGYIDGGPFDELYKRGTRYLLGDSRETQLLPVLYMIDDLEKWDDPTELRKSLPGLGVSVREEFIRHQIEIAKESPSKKGEFLTKYCNIKQNATAAWLSTAIVEAACGDALDPEAFRGCYCVGGVDLSQTRDLTACCIVVERDGELYVFAQFFLPRQRLEEAVRRDQIPYDLYVQRGLLQLSGENFVDYHDCFDWSRRVVEVWGMYPLKVGYDRYSAQYLVQDMAAYGFHMDDVYQGDNLWPVIQETEGLLRDGKIHIGDDDLLKIHLLDAAVAMDARRGRGKLVKAAPGFHIDGAAALLDAMTVRQKWYGEIGDQLRNVRENVREEE